MKKSAKWRDEHTVDAKCPHCGVWEIYPGDGVKEGSIIGACLYCGKAFKLGEKEL